MTPNALLFLLTSIASQSSTSSLPPGSAPPPPTATIGAPAALSIGGTQAKSREPAAPAEKNTSLKARTWVKTINEQVRGALKQTRSTQCFFYKEEWKNGDLVPTLALLKHRKRGDVFLAFSKGPNAGRQILYRPGKNDGDLLVSNPVINLNLDPDGFIATRNSRHTIRDAGVLDVARTLMRNYDRVREIGASAATLKNLGRRKIGGEATRCYRSRMNKRRYPELYAAQTDICVSLRTGLPVEVKVWQNEGGRLRRVGLYRYTKCKLNTLRNLDFDPENPAYKF